MEAAEEKKTFKKQTKKNIHFKIYSKNQQTLKNVRIFHSCAQTLINSPLSFIISVNIVNLNKIYMYD